LVVYFVDIGGIVDYRCVNFLCFVDIGGIVDYQCVNFLFIFAVWHNRNFFGSRIVPFLMSLVTFKIQGVTV